MRAYEKEGRGWSFQAVSADIGELETLAQLSIIPDENDDWIISHFIRKENTEFLFD